MSPVRASAVRHALPDRSPAAPAFRSDHDVTEIIQQIIAPHREWSSLGAVIEAMTPPQRAVALTTALSSQARGRAYTVIDAIAHRLERCDELDPILTHLLILKPSYDTKLNKSRTDNLIDDLVDAGARAGPSAINGAIDAKRADALEPAARLVSFATAISSARAHKGTPKGSRAFAAIAHIGEHLEYSSDLQELIDSFVSNPRWPGTPADLRAGQYALAALVKHGGLDAGDGLERLFAEERIQQLEAWAQPSMRRAMMSLAGDLLECAIHSKSDHAVEVLLRLGAIPDASRHPVIMGMTPQQRLDAVQWILDGHAPNPASTALRFVDAHAVKAAIQGKRWDTLESLMPRMKPAARVIVLRLALQEGADQAVELACRHLKDCSKELRGFVDRLAQRADWPSATTNPQALTATLAVLLRDVDADVTAVLDRLFRRDGKPKRDSAALETLGADLLEHAARCRNVKAVHAILEKMPRGGLRDAVNRAAHALSGLGDEDAAIPQIRLALADSIRSPSPGSGSRASVRTSFASSSRTSVSSGEHA